MKRVLLACCEEDNPFFESSILGRSDIELFCNQDGGRSVDEAVKSAPDLLILCDHEDIPVEKYIDKISGSGEAVSFPVAVISDTKFGNDLPEFVKKVLDRGVRLDDFNGVMAGLLGLRARKETSATRDPMRLPRRKSPRFPVRIGHDMSKTERTFVAMAQDIMAPSLTIVSYHLLSTGQLYQMKFLGTKKASGVQVFSVKIIKEKTRNNSLGEKMIYSAEFVDPSAREVRSLLEKIIQELTI